jgi:hypothetical protein
MGGGTSYIDKTVSREKDERLTRSTQFYYTRIQELLKNISTSRGVLLRTNFQFGTFGVRKHQEKPPEVLLASEQ